LYRPRRLQPTTTSAVALSEVVSLPARDWYVELEGDFHRVLDGGVYQVRFCCLRVLLLSEVD
jgi:hypothetical protein